MDCQNNFEAIMSCARVVLELRRWLSGTYPLKKKATSKDGLIAYYVLLPQYASNLRPAN